MIPSHVLVDALSNAGLGLSTTENLFSAKSPEMPAGVPNPDPLVVVYDPPGEWDDHTFCGSATRRPSLQVVVTSEDYTVAFQKLHDIRAFVQSTRYFGALGEVFIAYGPFNLGMDPKERHRVGLNLRALVSA